MSNQPDAHEDSQHKKILFISRPLQAPWDEASKNLAHDLAKNITDADITVLTHGQVDDLPRNITQQSIYTEASINFSLWQKMLLIVWLIFNAKKYDVIHLFFTPSTLNARILKKIFPIETHVIQTIATVREDLYGPVHENLTLYRDIFFADTLITFSQYAHNLLDKAGFENVLQIYPGIDLKKYYPTAKSPELVKKWNIKLNDFIIAYPGEFTRLGATDVIVDAFLEIWSDPANAHIKYLCACRIKNVADESKKSAVRERFRKAGHLDKVIFSDTFTGNMNDIYNLADLILFPVVTMAGKFDVPLAMIEPYACKKLVVASDLPVFTEFSHNDINVIIPKNSSKEIQKAILSIVQNSSKHVRRGEQAFNFVHHNFDIKNIAAKYKELYDTIN